MFFAQVIQTTGYLVVAFIVSWPLALASVGRRHRDDPAPAFPGARAAQGGRTTDPMDQELVTFLLDTLNNVKPLRAMAKERALPNLLEDKTAALKKALRRQVVSAEGLRNGNEILAAICLGAGFFVAISLWQVPIVDLVVVGLLLSRTTSGVAKIQQHLQKALMVESAFLEVQELITETGAAPEPNFGAGAALFERECRLENVSFGHVGTPVLSAMSLVVPAGQVTVLTGLSGAGKTTIADLILGLYQPDQGQVLLDDVPLREIDLTSWRSLVGYVPQELVLFHDSIFANVALGDRRIGEGEVRHALEMAGAWDFVAACPRV